MHFVKLKDNDKWNLGSGCYTWDKYNRSPKPGECDNICPDKCCWWNDSNEDIDDYLNKNNYYYEIGFENAKTEWNIIKLIEKEMGISLDLDGCPVCNPEKFNKFCVYFRKWMNEKWCNRIVFENPDEYPCIGEEYIEFDRIKDFFEYVETAAMEGFTLWLS